LAAQPIYDELGYPIRTTAGGEGGDYARQGQWTIVLHATAIPQAEFQEFDTNDWVANWASPSHLVVDPIRLRRIKCVPFNRYAKSLRNLSGGVETNRDRVLQVEIHWGGMFDGTNPMPEAQYRWIALQMKPMLEWARNNGGLDFDNRRVYPSGWSMQGAFSPSGKQRISFQDWEADKYWLVQHANVPENDHADIGNTFNMEFFAQCIKDTLNPVVPNLVPLID